MNLVFGFGKSNDSTADDDADMSATRKNDYEEPIDRRKREKREREMDVKEKREINSRKPTSLNILDGILWLMRRNRKTRRRLTKREHPYSSEQH